MASHGEVQEALMLFQDPTQARMGWAICGDLSSRRMEDPLLGPVLVYLWDSSIIKQYQTLEKRHQAGIQCVHIPLYTLGIPFCIVKGQKHHNTVVELMCLSPSFLHLCCFLFGSNPNWMSSTTVRGASAARPRARTVVGASSQRPSWC